MTKVTIKQDFTKEYLSECLVYGRNSGSFTWLRRPLEHFVSVSACNTWNAKNEGEQACKISTTGYQVINIDGVTLSAHHIAFVLLTGVKPKEVDHANGIRSDNRWANIRSVSRSENTKNRKRRSDNTSGVMGVCFRKDNGKWRAKININGKRVTLGQFKTKEEAVTARLEAEKRYGYHENHGRKE